MENKDYIIVIQGPSDYVEQQKKAWSDFTIVWSTWIGEETKYRKEDITIFNEIPNDRGINNFALQQKSTLSGLERGKELGFKKAIKWRSDLIPTNSKKLLELFKPDYLNFLSWHNTGNYFVDYFLGGNIDELLEIWKTNKIYAQYAEEILTEQMKRLNYSNINFILEDLSNDNEIKWLKYNLNLSEYKSNIYFDKKYKK
jgi:hypothetical protein